MFKCSSRCSRFKNRYECPYFREKLTGQFPYVREKCGRRGILGCVRGVFYFLVRPWVLGEVFAGTRSNSNRTYRRNAARSIRGKGEPANIKLFRQGSGLMEKPGAKSAPSRDREETEILRQIEFHTFCRRELLRSANRDWVKISYHTEIIRNLEETLALLRPVSSRNPFGVSKMHLSPTNRYE